MRYPGPDMQDEPLARVRPDDTAAALAHLARDGAVAFESVLDHATVTALAAGLDVAVSQSADALRRKGMATSDAGIAHHILTAHPAFAEFLAALPAAGTVDRFLGGSFILNSFGGLLNRPSGPGEYLHRWHRDLRAFAASDDIRLMINMLVALDPFTADNGATLLDLGSHRAVRRDDRPERVVRFEAPAGSVLLFDSRLFHAAGSNRSAAERRALTLTFTPPYFKPQIDHVKQFGVARTAAAGELLKRRLGWYARIPESLDDWYNPPEQRFYREDR